MKHFAYILGILFAATLCLNSCDDTDGTTPPTWYGFQYNPTTVYPGDTVYVRACQSKKGNLLNATDYTFAYDLKTLDADGNLCDTTITHTRHTNYGGKDNSDPRDTLCIPANANSGNRVTATCSFSAKYSNSADGEMGQYSYSGQTPSGYYGSITSNCYTLYSEAHGSFTFTISSK